jgi:hypothetical protein
MNRPLLTDQRGERRGMACVPLRRPRTSNLNVHLQKARAASLYNLAGLAVSAAWLLMRGQ